MEPTLIEQRRVDFRAAISPEAAPHAGCSILFALRLRSRSEVKTAARPLRPEDLTGRGAQTDSAERIFEKSGLIKQTHCPRQLVLADSIDLLLAVHSVSPRRQARSRHLRTE